MPRISCGSCLLQYSRTGRTWGPAPLERRGFLDCEANHLHGAVVEQSRDAFLSSERQWLLRAEVELGEVERHRTDALTGEGSLPDLRLYKRCMLNLDSVG